MSKTIRGLKGFRTALSTDKLEALLAELPAGPWTRLFGMAEATVCPTDAYDAFMRPGSTQTRVLRIIHDGDPRDPISVYIAEAIALVPDLIREVITARARIAELDSNPAALTPAPDAAQTDNATLVEALRAAEKALSDMCDDDVEEGGRITWFEARALKTLPKVRTALASREAHPDAPQPEGQVLALADGVAMARARLEIIADQMIAGLRDGGLVAGRELKRALVGVFADVDDALTPAPQPEGQAREAQRYSQYTICEDCGKEILHDEAAWSSDGSSYCRTCRTLTPAPDAAQTEAAIVPPGCSGCVLVFDGGSLRVNKDGSGCIVVDEGDFTLEDDRQEGPDGPEGSVHWIARFPAGEMTALRDFLNGQRFDAPAAQTEAVPAPVAWRIRPYVGCAWRLCDIIPPHMMEDWQREPLYAHPAAPAPGIAEALRVLLTIVKIARNDGLVDSSTQAGGWLCGDVMSEAVEAADEALRALEGRDNG